jgi:hypothetical protein
MQVHTKLETKMNLRSWIAAGLIAATLVPFTAEAQGLVGGAREGAARGERDAGPVGAIVGGAIGAGVGTVNGALGIPGPYYRHCRHGSYWRHGHRYCR